MSVKISELPVLSPDDIAAGDVVPIVDASAGETKKIDLHALRGNAVLQVVQGTRTVNLTFTAETDNVVTAEITPRSTSSKVAVLVFGRCAVDDGVFQVQEIFRDVVRVQASSFGNGLGGYSESNMALGVLDSPNTTSSITYRLRVNRADGSDNAYIYASSAAPLVMILAEIAG